MTLLINPPPTDRKCQRCGKHISELQPFEEGQFKDALLAKTFRAMCEEQYLEYDKILSEYQNLDNLEGDNISELEAKYGKEKVEQAFFYDQLSNTVEASWECKDCIIK